MRELGGALAAAKKRQITVIKVHQWLRGWNKIDFSEKEYRRRPEPCFFLFSLSAVHLRSLSGISRRQASNLTPRAADLGIQREHDPERSDEIGRFVEFGFPWSTLSEVRRRSSEFHDLRKPGWLPTAIVINILREKDERDGNTVVAKDLIKVIETTDGCRLELPYADWSPEWRPTGIPPLEVIDGQHRLWAFNEKSDADFELPVVAFHGLDTSWQAYLFWTINIKPKRINASLAFDLYPLLRSEDWLDRGEGHSVYRETRSQELTEALWSHPDSPWYDRINMLGERKNPWVSQSAWVRSLMATFVKRWISRSKVGGLFGSRARNVEDEVLGWT
jgi:DGQHR domain-containing protein